MSREAEQSFLRPGERIDDLQRNGLKIIQDPKRFCFGMDAVLLSGFAKLKPQSRCIDLGTGTGILPLLLSAKTEAGHFTGLEIQPDSADMARRSVEMNGLTDRIRICEGNIKEASKIFGKACFDAVTCNPPYMAGGHGISNPGDAKAIARHEVLCSFEDVARESALLLKEGGHLFLVHRPMRLPELMATLARYHLEPKRMRLVHPYVDKEPNMVLLDCIRGGRPMLSMEPPLIIFEKPGQYSPEIVEKYGF